MSRRRSCSKHKLSPRARFYKSLRGYIITLIALFTFAIVLDNDFFDVFRLVAFWWGVVLAIRFMRLRGLPGTNGWLSDDWFDWIQERHPVESARTAAPNSDDRDGEDYDPLWKDKDLV
ncbi:MAG: hypothetical protein AAF828_08765 [Bacteroidota bacterium]